MFSHVFVRYTSNTSFVAMQAPTFILIKYVKILINQHLQCGSFLYSADQNAEEQLKFTTRILSPLTVLEAHKYQFSIKFYKALWSKYSAKQLKSKVILARHSNREGGIRKSLMQDQHVW